MFRSLSILSLLNARILGRASPLQQACNVLQSSYPSNVYSISSSEYESEVKDVWSETCITQPSCTFRPTDSQQLADGLAIIIASGCKFSVRSGGHMPVPGSNGVDGGVFISLSNLNQITLTDNNTLVSVGPGQTWARVYEYVSPYGLGVAGGRFSPVGVGGLLVGGGINYFASQVGWSFSTVKNYEVILANSSIVSANETHNPDLFWALRGGGNNFGIVTRYDMQTIAASHIYGGFTIFPQDQCEAFLDAVGSYAAPGGGSFDVKAAILPSINIDSATGNYTGSLVSFYNADDAAPAALANFTTMSQYATLDANTVSTSFSDYTNITNIPAFGAQTSRWLFASTAIQIAPETISVLNRTLMDTVQPQLRRLTERNGSTFTLSIQPMTNSMLQAARESGGDAIDLDPEQGAFYSVLLNMQWQSAADDDTVNDISRQFISNLDAASHAAGLHYNFTYMNDAQAGQSIFEHYGNGRSIRRLKHIQSRYDPDHKFSRLFNTGFPL